MDEVKFVQIAACTSEENQTLYALGNDGRVYMFASVRHAKGSTYKGRKVKEAWWSEEFWGPVPMIFAEPELPPRLESTHLEVQP